MTDISDDHLIARSMASKKLEVGLWHCPSCGSACGLPGTCVCSTATSRNAAGHVVRHGSSTSADGGDTHRMPAQLWYCGRDTGPCRCGNCPPRCGPDSGCPCDTCIQLVSGWRVNRSRRLAKPGYPGFFAGDTRLAAHHVYYCGAKRDCRCGGCRMDTCGPHSGCPCEECLELVGLRVNGLGRLARPGSPTGVAGDLRMSAKDVYYCGQGVVCRCTEGCTQCGPQSGCPCPACLELLGHRINSDGVLARKPDPAQSSGYGGDTRLHATQLYYCGRSMGQCRCTFCDGVCGPDQGCPCNSCLQLVADRLPRRGAESEANPFESEVEEAVWNMDDSVLLRRTLSSSTDLSRGSQPSVSSLLTDYVNSHHGIDIPGAHTRRPRPRTAGLPIGNPPGGLGSWLLSADQVANQRNAAPVHALADTSESVLDVWIDRDSVPDAVHAPGHAGYRGNGNMAGHGSLTVGTSRGDSSIAGHGVGSRHAAYSRRHSTDGVLSRETGRRVGAESAAGATTSYAHLSSPRLTHPGGQGAPVRNPSLSQNQGLFRGALQAEGGQGEGRESSVFATWQQQLASGEAGPSRQDVHIMQSLLSSISLNGRAGGSAAAGGRAVGPSSAMRRGASSDSVMQSQLSTHTEEGNASASNGARRLSDDVSHGSHAGTSSRTGPLQIMQAHRGAHGNYHQVRGSTQPGFQFMLESASTLDDDGCLSAWTEEDDYIFGRISITEADVQALLAEEEEVHGRRAEDDVEAVRDQLPGSQHEAGPSERPGLYNPSGRFRTGLGMPSYSHSRTPVTSADGTSGYARLLRNSVRHGAPRAGVGNGNHMLHQWFNDAQPPSQHSGRLMFPISAHDDANAANPTHSGAATNQQLSSNMSLALTHGHNTHRHQLPFGAERQDGSQAGPSGMGGSQQYRSGLASLRQEAGGGAQFERDDIRAGIPQNPTRPRRPNSLLAHQLKSLRETAAVHRTICVVCMDRARCIALVPCGHYSYCLECARALRRCAVCRAGIEHILRVYF